MPDQYKASDYTESHDVKLAPMYGMTVERAAMLAAILEADKSDSIGPTWKVDPAAGTVTRAVGERIAEEIVYSDGANGYDMLAAESYDYSYTFEPAEFFGSIHNVQHHMGPFLDDGKPFLFQSVAYDEYPVSDDAESENIGWLFLVKVL